MARAEDKHGFTSAYSPIREHSPSREGLSHAATNDFEDVGSASGYGCFSRFCCFGWNQTNRESKYLLQQNQNGGYRDSWLGEKFKELKEFSEVVAGPKWKNFVRKIGKYCNPKRARTQWTYSPQSYALNFDDGFEEENDLFMSSSSIFSAPPPTSSDQKGRGSS